MIGILKAHSPRKQVGKLILMFGGICLCASGCEEEYRVRGDFFYLNSSGFNVVIRRYNFVTDSTMTALAEIKIRPKAEYKASVTSEGPADMNCEDFPLAIKADSLSITYSNGKVSAFNLQDTASNNPLLIRNYANQKVAQNTCVFQFTIK
jgi:hypothetical protein